MTQIEFNFFLRYLKDKKIYTTFMKDARKTYLNRVERTVINCRMINFKNFLLNCKPTEPIMNCIFWDESSAGPQLWSKHYSNYIAYYIKNYKKYDDEFNKKIN